MFNKAIIRVDKLNELFTNINQTDLFLKLSLLIEKMLTLYINIFGFNKTF